MVRMFKSIWEKSLPAAENCDIFEAVKNVKNIEVENASAVLKILTSN